MTGEKPKSDKPAAAPSNDTGLEEKLSQSQIDDDFFPQVVFFDLPSSQSSREYDTSNVMIEDDDDD